MPRDDARCAEPDAAAPPGQRLYAIGDVHGRFDLFEALVAAIHTDNAGRARCPVTIILLGNLIDRGPGSAALVERLHDWSRRSAQLVVLKGSHEEMMVEALDGRLGVLSVWLSQGGDRTLESWGVPVDVLAEGAARKILEVARAAVPQALIGWLSALPLGHTAGDYHFVHAGIRPGVPLDRQQQDDLLWIEEPFLSSSRLHPKVIVHGHSVAGDGPVIRANRINLNTDAVRSGRLSALGLEARNRWLVST